MKNAFASLLLAGATLGLAGSAFAADDAAKAEYKRAKDTADADYKAAKGYNNLNVDVTFAPQTASPSWLTRAASTSGRDWVKPSCSPRSSRRCLAWQSRASPASRRAAMAMQSSPAPRPFAATW